LKVFANPVIGTRQVLPDQATSLTVASVICIPATKALSELVCKADQAILFAAS
jgi:hypothetical protein